MKNIDWGDKLFLTIILFILAGAVMLASMFFVARAPGVWKVIGAIGFVLPLWGIKKYIQALRKK